MRRCDDPLRPRLICTAGLMLAEDPTTVPNLADQARSWLRQAATFGYRLAVVGTSVTTCAPPEPNGATWNPSTSSTWPSVPFITC
jgi:hypothetical protein